MFCCHVNFKQLQMVEITPQFLQRPSDKKGWQYCLMPKKTNLIGRVKLLTMESFILFTISYACFVICFLYPPPSFLAFDLTVELLFRFLLKNESDSFIHYHIKRTAITFMTHSSLLLVYFLLSIYWFSDPLINFMGIWCTLTLLSHIPPIMCAFMIYSWYEGKWRNHPIARQLKNFVPPGSDINQIARDIDNEFRSINKVIIGCNTVTKIVATENWLIKVSAYELNIAHQGDISLMVTSSNEYNYTPGACEDTQYLNIDVKNDRAGVKPFKIRIKSKDFEVLQEKVSRPIVLLDDIVVHLSLADCFIDEFKKQVQQNTQVTWSESPGVCLGCMMTKPNVKIVKSCEDISGTENCRMCYCRPLWCVDCMGKWFASRMDQDRPDTWLSSKCSCPMCRSTFCILDVCPLFLPEAEDNKNK